MKRSQSPEFLNLNVEDYVMTYHHTSTRSFSPLVPGELHVRRLDVFPPFLIRLHDQSHVHTACASHGEAERGNPWRRKNKNECRRDNADDDCLQSRGAVKISSQSTSACAAGKRCAAASCDSRFAIAMDVGRRDRHGPVMPRVDVRSLTSLGPLVDHRRQADKRRVAMGHDHFMASVVQ